MNSFEKGQASGTPVRPAAEEDDNLLFSRAGSGAGSRDRDAGGGDREITLGTMTVLGIFFGLAVLCAGFFGFGYSIGAKRTPSVAAAGQASSVSSAGLPACKPAPGFAAQALPSGSAAPPVAFTPAVAPPHPPKAAAASNLDLLPSGSVPSGSGASSSPPAAPERVPHTLAATPAAPVATTSAAPSAGTQTMVQVAAVSHQEDAELLVSTLKSRGYNVAIHNSSTDKLLHIQIGPFATRKDADVTRQKLLGDGFNAILK